MINFTEHRSLTILIQTGSGNFEVLLQKKKNMDHSKVIMTGTIQIPYDNPKITINEDQVQEMKVKITQEEFYKNLQNIGFQLNDDFVNVKGLAFNETGKLTLYIHCFYIINIKYIIIKVNVRNRILWHHYME